MDWRQSKLLFYGARFCGLTPGELTNDL